MGDEYDENEFEEDFGDADEPGNVEPQISTTLRPRANFLICIDN